MTQPHNTSLYVPAGRGILYIAEWSGTTPPTYPGTPASQYPGASDIAADLGDFVDVGNCVSLEVEPTKENRPHYSSRANLRLKDLNPVVSVDYMLNFELDEIAAGNLTKFLMGTYSAVTSLLQALQATDKEYAVIFISDNPVGPNQNRYFRRVTLGPGGPEQLIGDEYLSLSYSGEGLADVANHPESPYFDLKYITTTTTSTSSSTTTTTTTV